LLSFEIPDTLKYQKHYINVRYRLEIKDDIFCIDDFGYCYHNDVYKGRLKSFQKFLKYIKENKAKSLLLDKNSILATDKEQSLL